MKQEPLSTHHIIPRNGVDLHGTNDERNKILLPEHIHVNIHRVFGNLEFHNKVLLLLANDRPVLQSKFASELKKLMSEKVNYIYHNGVYRKNESI